MTDTQRLRKCLLSIQERIKAIGSTNRNRWASMTMGSTLEFNAFMDKLSFFGNQTSKDDADTIWRSIGIKGKIMQYVDFLKLMQEDIDDFKPVFSERDEPMEEPVRPQERFQKEVNAAYNPPAETYSQPQSSGQSVRETIHGNIKSVINDCIDADSILSGEISQRAFTDICARLGIQTNDAELAILLRESDPSGSGLISYFQMAANVCRSEQEPQQPVEYRPQPAEYRPQPAEYRPQPAEYRQQPERAAAPTQPTATQRRVIPQRQLEESFKPEPMETPAHDARGSSAPQLSAQISRAIMDNIGNTKAAFSRWRGRNEKLTAADLHAGLLRDANTDIPVSEIETIVTQYGGPLNLNNFVRLVSGGAPSEEVSSSRPITTQSRKMTSDEEALETIAAQVTGPEWENVIFKSNNSDDMVRGLKRLGINADEYTLRKLSSKLGKTGLIDAIRKKVGRN